MKKIIIFFLCSLLLISCGSGIDSTDSNAKKGLTQYTATGFILGIPATWEDTTASGANSITPNIGKLEAAFVSKQIKKGFKNNLIVLSYKLKKFQTSTQFAIANNTVSKQQYHSYTPISNKYIDFNDKQQSMLYVFRAKYNQNTPELTFIQTARVCGVDKVYVPTIAIPKNISDTAKYEQILTTFTCRVLETATQ